MLHRGPDLHFFESDSAQASLSGIFSWRLPNGGASPAPTEPKRVCAFSRGVLTSPTHACFLTNRSSSSGAAKSATSFITSWSDTLDKSGLFDTGAPDDDQCAPDESVALQEAVELTEPVSRHTLSSFYISEPPLRVVLVSICAPVPACAPRCVPQSLAPCQTPPLLTPYVRECKQGMQLSGSTSSVLVASANYCDGLAVCHAERAAMCAAPYPDPH